MKEKLELKPKPAPIGKARELNEVKETWPVIDVDNEVTWVNDDIYFPFDLKVGEKADLVSLLSLDELDTRKIELTRAHTRSGILGRVIFKDKKGNLYRDVDAKGIGLSMSVDGESPVVTNIDDKNAGKYGPREAPGFQRLQAANYEAEFAEKLFKIEVRTSRVIAIAKLKEILTPEGKMSLDEATEKKIIPIGYTPAASIRAFGTRARVGERSPDKVVKLFYDDARMLVAQELGRDPESFTFKDYLKWFAENIARNMGLLHKNGMYFKYAGATSSPYPFNVSLDCRMVDHESVGYLNHFSSEEARKELVWIDLEAALKITWYIRDELKERFNIEVGNPSYYRQIIQKNYYKLLNLPHGIIEGFYKAP